MRNALDTPRLFCHKQPLTFQIEFTWQAATMLAKSVRAGMSFVLVLMAGCVARDLRPYHDLPPADIKATRIDYVDADAFDVVLETDLTNQDPVILIQTSYQKPEWGGRLNGWIAAWNLGGKVDANKEKRTLRFQIPAVTVDKDSIREFRLLVGGFMDRVDQLAKDTSVWWSEEKVRNRRIALLKPYNLRFNQDEDGNIQLIFFNGRYARYYEDFMTKVARADGDAEAGWTRAFTCSRCKPKQNAQATGSEEKSPSAKSTAAPQLTALERDK